MGAVGFSRSRSHVAAPFLHGISQPTEGMDIPLSEDQIFEEYQKHKYPSECKSLVRKHLDADTFKKAKGKKTKLGGTIAHCIYNGVAEITASMGFLACDPEAYTTYADLSDKLIRDYHRVEASEALSHPPADYGDLNKLPFGDLDPENKYVVSTRVRVGRTAEGYPWPPLISKAQRNEIEKRAITALQTLPDEFKGKYYPLLGMDKATENQLIEDHFLFGNDDKYNVPGGVYRDWPEGRGIFYNVTKTFLVWVNEEDHFRLISMEKGGNLGRTYKRLVTAIQHIEKQIPFARSDKLGNLTFCPTNLGTSLRASVHAKIPKVAAEKELFDKLCEQYGIQARGIHGEHTESVGGVYDLSNKRRLGITEVAAVKEMADGVKAILAKEATL